VDAWWEEAGRVYTGKGGKVCFDWLLGRTLDFLEQQPHLFRYLCGGVWSHAEFIAAASDPKHPRRSRLVEWMGPGWNPERFSVEDVNRRLRETFPDS